MGSCAFACVVVQVHSCTLYLTSPLASCIHSCTLIQVYLGLHPCRCPPCASPKLTLLLWVCVCTAFVYCFTVLLYYIL